MVRSWSNVGKLRAETKEDSLPSRLARNQGPEAQSSVLLLQRSSFLDSGGNRSNWSSRSHQQPQLTGSRYPGGAGLSQKPISRRLSHQRVCRGPAQTTWSVPDHLSVTEQVLRWTFSRVDNWRKLPCPGTGHPLPGACHLREQKSGSCSLWRAARQLLTCPVGNPLASGPCCSGIWVRPFPHTVGSEWHKVAARTVIRKSRGREDSLWPHFLLGVLPFLDLSYSQLFSGQPFSGKVR